jgi:hypothetical protein
MITEERMLPIPGDGFVVWVDERTHNEFHDRFHNEARSAAGRPLVRNWAKYAAVPAGNAFWPVLRPSAAPDYMGYPVMSDIDEDHDYPLGDFVGDRYSGE